MGEKRYEHPTPRCSELRYALSSVPGYPASLATRLRTVTFLKGHGMLRFKGMQPYVSGLNGPHNSGHVEVLLGRPGVPEWWKDHGALESDSRV